MMSAGVLRGLHGLGHEVFRQTGQARRVRRQLEERHLPRRRRLELDVTRDHQLRQQESGERLGHRPNVEASRGRQRVGTRVEMDDLVSTVHDGHRDAGGALAGVVGDARRRLLEAHARLEDRG